MIIMPLKITPPLYLRKDISKPWFREADGEVLNVDAYLNRKMELD
jgi:hypothetical protein